MATLTTLTAELTKRVNNAILETQRMLNKELAYSKDLQHANRIAEMEAHIVRLNEIIANHEIALKAEIPTLKEGLYGSEERFSKVKEINRNQITVLPELFQGRQVAYAEETVNKIESEGYDKSYEPIIVWFDKHKNKYVVISGHSRWEASERLYKGGDKSLKTMPVKEFFGDKEEAVSYAVIESNRASTQEGKLSDINAVSKMLKEGYNKTEMLKYIKPKSYLEKTINYTYLNPAGKFIEYLTGETSTSFPYIERNAEWVGILRKMYGEKLTNAHENEIFDYIYLTDKKGISIRKDELFNLIDRRVNNILFNIKEPLNLKNLPTISPLTNPVKELIKELEKEVSDMENEISNKQDLIVRAKNEGDKEDLIAGFKKTISNLSERIINTKTRISNLESEIKSIERQTTQDLFTQPKTKAEMPILKKPKTNRN